MEVDIGIKYQLGLGSSSGYIHLVMCLEESCHYFGSGWHIREMRVRLTHLPSRLKSNGILTCGTGFNSCWWASEVLHHLPCRNLW